MHICEHKCLLAYIVYCTSTHIFMHVCTHMVNNVQYITQPPSVCMCLHYTQRDTDASGQEALLYLFAHACLKSSQVLVRAVSC